ncbi:MAG: site-specific DNA-methyltransferase [Flavobacterium sp.]|nr:site-specific DNA-methyltransferase [Flavobacterium sp.]
MEDIKTNSGNSENSKNSGSDNVWMPLSNDWNKERLETLKQLFPDLFTNEGKLNINELKKVVDPESVSETERYEFRWFGKSAAKREAFSPSNATLVFDEKRSVNPTATENLIIEGENLEVLKLLSTAYREKVKCIYIDPPYNTGKDFVYSDNYSQDKKAYWEDAGVTEEGLKIDTNTETDGRYHSNWLNMMYSRLLIARQLLREDGVIFISIDDTEVHHLRKLCDEVFGEENFISTVIWERSFSPVNLKKHFSLSHDYILCVSKNIELLENFGIARNGDNDDGRYNNPDNDPRGDWTSSDMTVGPAISEKIYEIKTPSGKVVLPTSGRCWLFTKERYEEMLADNRIWFGENGSNVPRVKKFLTEVKQGITPMTIWKYSEVGHSQEAAQRLKELFDGKDIFDYPKSVPLLKRLLQLYTTSNDIILDFFAGSGSCGQAVFELNKEDGNNRKFILVQIPEVTDEKSEAFKAGYKKISDITIERNKRVADRIIKEKKKEQPDLFTNGHKEDAIKGLGFKVFKLVKSNFPRVEFAPDPEKTTEENIELLKKYIRDKEAQLNTAFNRDELVTEILIKNGFTLNYTLTKQEEFKKNDIFFATDGEKETLICLDISIDMETVEHFKKHNTQKFICLERALDTTKKWNLKHYLGDKFNAF